ncbi:MAG: hypothetical protein ACLFWR_11275 [Acidimicrobiales bacterium]
MQPLGGNPGADGGDVDLDEWADRARVDTAGQLRRREAWLRRQAAEDASVVGVLITHAERGSTVSVTTCSGNRYVGRVRGAGWELVTVEVTGALGFIRLDSIETFRAHHGDGAETPDPVGHRGGADPISMGEVLGLVVADRPEVTLVSRSGRQLAGELVAVGRDVVMVRPPEQRGLAYAPLASVSEALVPASTGSG